MGIRDFFTRHDIAVLRRPPVAGADASCRGLDARPLSDPADIRKAHVRLGHSISDAMLERRLASRLQFLIFSAAEDWVASTWLSRGGRYIDEVNWLFPTSPAEAWLRDVFVAPAWRGRRLFSEITLLLSRGHDGEALSVWSDVDWKNESSMRAHRAAGFDIVGRVRALDVAGRLRVRSALPQWRLPVTEIEPASRLVWLRGNRLKRHRELRA